MPNLKQNPLYQSNQMAQGISNIANRVGSELAKMPNKRTPQFPNIKMPTNAPVTTPYGGSTKYESFHPGIDLGYNMGTPLKSPVSGKVVEGVLGKKQGDTAFGNYVVIQDEYGNRHRFSHLQNEFVKIGQQIPVGYTFGTVGNTGQTYSLTGGTGSHLDYRIVDAYNKYINPAKFLKGLG